MGYMKHSGISGPKAIKPRPGMVCGINPNPGPPPPVFSPHLLNTQTVFSDPTLLALKNDMLYVGDVNPTNRLEIWDVSNKLIPVRDIFYTFPILSCHSKLDTLYTS